MIWNDKTGPLPSTYAQVETRRTVDTITKRNAALDDGSAFYEARRGAPPCGAVVKAIS